MKNTIFPFPSASFALANNFSIEVVAKTNPSTGSNNVVLAKGPNSARHYEVYLNDAVHFYGFGIGDVSGAASVVDGAWHHHLIAYDGSSIKFYLDGKLSRSNVASGSLLTTSATFSIGHETEPTQSFKYFTGSVGPTRIYGRSLSAQEANLNCYAAADRYAIHCSP